MNYLLIFILCLGLAVIGIYIARFFPNNNTRRQIAISACQNVALSFCGTWNATGISMPGLPGAKNFYVILEERDRVLWGWSKEPYPRTLVLLYHRELARGETVQVALLSQENIPEHPDSLADLLFPYPTGRNIGK